MVSIIIRWSFPCVDCCLTGLLETQSLSAFFELMYVIDIITLLIQVTGGVLEITGVIWMANRYIGKSKYFLELVWSLFFRDRQCFETLLGGRLYMAELTTENTPRIESVLKGLILIFCGFCIQFLASLISIIAKLIELPY